MLFNKNIKIILISISIYFFISNTRAEEAYFDISDEEIKIETNFNGKEIIVFGLTDPKLDTILMIQGPKKNIKLSLKESFFGLWIDSKRIIYKNLPSIFFIASTSPIDEILNEDTIIKKELLFEKLLVNTITKRNFINKKNSDNWNSNLIRLQKEKGLYSEFKLKIVDKKLFQTRVFFPSNTNPGIYKIKIFQVKDKKIISERIKKIIVKKTGIGEKIYQFANKQPASYGILCILFAIICGFAAATAFRRL